MPSNAAGTCHAQPDAVAGECWIQRTTAMIPRKRPAAAAGRAIPASLSERLSSLVDDIIFGARCAAYADAAFARHVFARWGTGASSLRRPVAVGTGVAS